jgi:hypothetical protein
MGIECANVGPFKAWQLIAVIGAIIGIVSFFLVWEFEEFTMSSLVKTVNMMTGLDLFNDADITDYQKYIPLLVLIFGAVALILSLIPCGKISNHRVAPVVVLICGLLMAVLSVVFSMWNVVSMSLVVTTYTSGPEIGCWIGLVSGIIVLLSALPPLLIKDA